jgi:hypothetical protein
LGYVGSQAALRGLVAVFEHSILATVSTKLPRPVIPSEVARLFLPRSLLRTSRATQSRNPSSIDRASHFGFHHWLLAITPTVHSVRPPSIRSSRSCSSRQFRHKHPVVSPAFKTGTGPCGISAHQQSPSGLQLMSASQRVHRVSITPFSPIAPPLEPSSGFNLSAHFVPGLTQLRICGTLIVYAAWFLRAVA